MMEVNSSVKFGVNYVLWEKHERNGYKYSATMKQVQSSQQEWAIPVSAMENCMFESSAKNLYFFLKTH